MSSKSGMIEAACPAASPARVPLSGEIQGIYVHIPFCVHKCPYCDFASGPAEGERRKDYLDALRREIEASDWAGARPMTLYFGGGTPSELTVPEWEHAFSALREQFDLSGLEEFTVECNPGTLNRRKLQVLRGSGVNRLSFGVQSFQDDLLAVLERIHDGTCAMESLALAREEGFTNISLDLMFGLPGQTFESWKRDLDRAVSFQPSHLSLYALTLEPGTPFFELERAGQLAPLGSDEAADLFEYCMEYCSSNGYEQYEISNFCRPGLESRHNLLYWTNGNFLGLGVSAASHIEGERWANVRSQSDYVAGWQQGEMRLEYREFLPPAGRAAEEIMLRLRLNDGFDMADLEKRYTLPLSERYAGTLQEMEERGLLENQAGRIRLTTSGRLLASEVTCAFLD